MEIGKLIKSEIKRQGKKQNEVAKLLGISQNALSQICIGATFPHKNTLDKICEVLSIKIRFYIEKSE